jgi:hypothetical protein
MSRKIAHVIGRFQRLRVQIEEAALQDTRFRSLCEDYAVAVEAVQFWSQSSDARAPQMILEFQRLQADLESEILSDLQHRPGGPLYDA